MDSNSRRHRQVGFQPLCVSSHLCHSWNPTDSMPRHRWNPTHTIAKRSGIQLWLRRRDLDSKSTARRARWIPTHALIFRLDSNSRSDFQVGFQLTSSSGWIPTHVFIIRLDSNLSVCLHIYVTVGIQLTQCQDVVGIQHTLKQRDLESNFGCGGVSWIPSRLLGEQVGFQLTP